MLIATLPTLVSDKDLVLTERILSHPLIDGVRYNTGGASPYSPEEILSKLAPLAKENQKKLYIDLEGRQVRIAEWSPFASGTVALNHNFEIELPGKIHFRGLGWFEIINADPEKRTIFFDAGNYNSKYYLGKSQSVHVVASKFKVQEYIANHDGDFISAAIKSGVRSFMLSFVESFEDLSEFHSLFGACDLDEIGPPEIVLKIESIQGVKFIRRISKKLIRADNLRLMAARDDLFLAHVDKRAQFLETLELIIEKDPEAIVASKIMSGLESENGLTIGDITDITLMAQLGYKNFMFSDELTKRFNLAIDNWENVAKVLIARGSRNE